MARRETHIQHPTNGTDEAAAANAAAELLAQEVMQEAEAEASQEGEADNDTTPRTVAQNVDDVTFTLLPPIHVGYVVTSPDLAGHFSSFMFSKYKAAKKAENAKRLEKNLPLLTANELIAGFDGFVPEFGGYRDGTSDDLNRVAAWNIYKRRAEAHNALVAAKVEDVAYFPRAGAALIVIPRVNSKSKPPVSAADVEAAKDNIVDAMLGRPEYADEIAIELASLQAKRKAPSEDKPIVTTSGVSFF